MTRQRFLTLAAVGVAVAVGLWAAIGLRKPPPDASVSYLREARLWRWQLHRLPDLPSGTSLTLTVRCRAKPDPDRSETTIDRIRKGEATREYRLSNIHQALNTRSASDEVGSVVVQLIDVRTLGVEASAGAPFRLPRSLTIGGSRTMAGPTECVIEGDQYAGQEFAIGPRWEDGELHLLGFSTRGGGTFFAYNVMIETRPPAP